jgi:hypothetical protein
MTLSLKDVENIRKVSETLDTIKRGMKDQGFHFVYKNEMNELADIFSVGEDEMAEWLALQLYDCKGVCRCTWIEAWSFDTWR